MLGIVQFYFYFKTSLAVGGIDYKHTRGLQRSGRRPHEGLGMGGEPNRLESGQMGAF